jgi:phosphate transport system permease protein
MSATLADQATTRPANRLTAGRLPTWTTGVTLSVAMLISASLFVALGSVGVIRILVVGALIFTLVMMALSSRVEGFRKAKDRLARIVVTSAFILALLPLISLVTATIGNGLDRFDVQFFTYSMRSVVGEGGGAVHAITGTLWVTGMATLISVPIGLLAAIYLVEYGEGKPLARSITFFVDVMTGIPSIVAGLFAYAVFVLIFGPGTKSAVAGAVALAVLMIPIVVRSVEELLRIVPNELREASYALGVPKWLTVVKIVLPTALAGIITGVMLAIARVIGETAPLLIAMGFTQSLNNNPVDGPMMTLPVFVYRSYVDQGNPASAYLERAWAGALTLILIVMLLNLAGRLIATKFAPKTGH